MGRRVAELPKLHDIPRSLGKPKMFRVGSPRAIREQQAMHDLVQHYTEWIQADGERVKKKT